MHAQITQYAKQGFIDEEECGIVAHVCVDAGKKFNGTKLKIERALLVVASAHAPGKAFCELG